MSFGASISCAHFQSFSDAVKHIVEWKINLSLQITVPSVTNYLDDFLFVTITLYLCTKMVKIFLRLCQQIGCPISGEKTEWLTQVLIFLGILLNSRNLSLSVPIEKRVMAIQLLQETISRKKVKVQFVQKIMGTLNFLNHAIVPGRAFTRGMYERLTLKDKHEKLLKNHHHVHLNQEFLMDCRMWLEFLMDIENECVAQHLDLSKT